MRVAWFWSGIAVLWLGCWAPVVEFPLGTVDGGADGGVTGGGTATGGGAATGGGTATGGGGPSTGGGVGGGTATGGGGGTTTGGGGGTSTGGGAATGGGGSEGEWQYTVTSPGIAGSAGTIPLASCGRVRDYDHSCADGGVGCLAFKPNGGAVSRIPLPEPLERVVSATEDGLLVQSGGYTLVEVTRTGTTRIVFTTNATMLRTTGVSFEPGTATWFVAQTGTNFALFNYTPTSSFVTSVAVLPQEPTAEGFAMLGHYFTALSDGLHEYGANFPDLILPIPADQRIIHLASGGNEIIYVQCPLSTGTGCGVHSFNRLTLSARKLFTLNSDVGDMEPGGHAIQFHNGRYYVLGPRALLRFQLSAAMVETVYRGGPFPQWAGTLKPGSLVTRGSNLYFGHVCNGDADSPGYGTIEVDPYQAQSRWLDLDANWPAVPHITGYHPMVIEGPLWAFQPYGVFIGKR